MDLSKEKSNRLSAKDRYDILTFAIEAADDNGFVNSFVFERALYCYAAIVLTEDDLQEDIRQKVNNNLIEAWDYLVQNNIIQELAEEYGEELDQLANEGATWFEEYDKYATSARGILSLVETFTGNAVSNAATALQDTARQTGVANIIQLADEWGMNRDSLASPQETKDWEEKDEESLL